MGWTSRQPAREHRGYRFGDFELDLDRAALYCNGVDTHLRPQSFDILRLLVERHGCLVAKDELLKAVWGETAVTDDSLTHCIIDIRKILGDRDRSIIQTVPRRGFVFELPVESLQQAPDRRWWRSTMQAAAVIVLGVAAIYVLASGPQEQESTIAVSDTWKDARDHYEQGYFLFHRRAPGDLEVAREYFVQATELRPDFAEAWAGLAGTNYILSWQVGNGDDDEFVQALKIAAEKAIELNPDLAAGWMRLSNYYHRVEDKPAAERYFQRAIEADPNDPLVLGRLAGKSARAGDLDMAIELQRRATLLEPLSFVNRGNLSHFLFAAGRFEEAMIENQRAHQMRPAEAAEPDTLIGFSLIQLGSYDKALKVIAGWPDGSDKFAALAMAEFALGRDDLAAQAVGKLMKEQGTDTLLRFAELEAYCENIERAFVHLEEMRDGLLVRADPQAVSDWINKLHLSPFLQTLRSDPRWESWLEKTRELSTSRLAAKT